MHFVSVLKYSELSRQQDVRTSVQLRVWQQPGFYLHWPQLTWFYFFVICEILWNVFLLCLFSHVSVAYNELPLKKTYFRRNNWFKGQLVELVDHINVSLRCTSYISHSVCPTLWDGLELRSEQSILKPMNTLIWEFLYSALDFAILY